MYRGEELGSDDSDYDGSDEDGSTDLSGFIVSSNNDEDDNDGNTPEKDLAADVRDGKGLYCNKCKKTIKG